MKQRLINAWQDADAKFQVATEWGMQWPHLKRRERIRKILIKRYNYYTKY